jgi:methyl-accepting chemotaxis protein
MTNSSSLSKARLALAGAMAALAAMAIWHVASNDFVALLVDLVAVAGIGLGWWWLQTAIAKIDACVAVAQEAAKGVLEVRLVQFREGGELGRLAGHINRLLDLTEAFTKEAHAAMESANDRKYYRRIVPTGLRGGFVFYAGAINNSLALMEKRDHAFQDFATTKVLAVADTVAAAATELNASADSMASLSLETARQSKTAAGAADQASTNVQMVAAAVEEFTASIGEINSQVGRVASIADRAVQAVNHTDDAVRGLADATGKISSIVDLINKIAAQTNLLALNATIEAARAGDAGKGFAVVAGEVKTLATQTGKATSEIAAQIDRVQTVSAETTAAIRGVNDTVREIQHAASAVAGAIEEQKAVTQEIARNMTEAADATATVSGAVTTVNSVAAESSTGSREVTQAAGELSRNAAMLRTQIDEFLVQMVKAA